MRNKNVDILRGLALCIVMIYHIWVLSGSVQIHNRFLYTLIMLGGEIGVTMFFIISGFGICSALHFMEQKGELRFKEFLVKRMLRIAPEYYLSIFFVLLVSGGTIYFTKDGLDDILTHLTFTHNFMPSTAGTINGVLWTMAVTVQFYIVAIVLYKLLKRYPIAILPGAIGFTVLSKFVLLHMGPSFWGISENFWLSRQTLFSVIDNFVLGMFVAFLLINEKQQKKSVLWKQLVGIVLSVVGLYTVSIMGLKYGIHSDNISGYVWHSLVALCLAFGVYCCAKMNLEHHNYVSKIFLWLAKYEYGIYIVHLYTISFLLQHLSVIWPLNETNHVLVGTILFVGSVAVGYVFSIVVNTIRAMCIKFVRSNNQK